MCWSTVQATAAPGVSQEVLAARVTQALAGQPSLQVLTQKAYVKSESKQFKDQLKFFSILLLVFAFISVFVAVFIIFNTFTVLVAQRTRELALLRALGAARGRSCWPSSVRRSSSGCSPAWSGSVGGVLVAAGLRALIEALGGGGLVTVACRFFRARSSSASWSARSSPWSRRSCPAVRASRIPPVAAMRDDFVLPTASLRRRTRLGRGGARRGRRPALARRQVTAPPGRSGSARWRCSAAWSPCLRC